MTEHDEGHDPRESEPKALPGEPAATDAPLTPRTTGPKPELPVVVLRDMVIYPGVTVPMSVGRADTLSAIQAAAESPDRRIDSFSLPVRREAVTMRPAPWSRAKDASWPASARAACGGMR